MIEKAFNNLLKMIVNVSGEKESQRMVKEYYKEVLFCSEKICNWCQDDKKRVWEGALLQADRDWQGNCARHLAPYQLG